MESFCRAFSVYGFSEQGRGHKESDIVCQDAHKIAFFKGRVETDVFCFLAVADGVGSAPHSDKGAALAVSTLHSHCERHIKGDETDEQLTKLLRGGFELALSEITAMAKANDGEVTDYTTTLTACVFTGESVVIGHVGDGGIIAVGSDGVYRTLTTVQKGDAHNEVYTLPSQDMWSFTVEKGDFSALLLFTDGLWDMALPPVLAKESEPIYRGFVANFLPYAEQGTVPTSDSVRQRVLDLLSQDSYAHITDDISAVVLWKTDAPLTMPTPDYFAEPDWAAIQQNIFKRLYPNLPLSEEKGSGK